MRSFREYLKEAAAKDQIVAKYREEGGVSDVEFDGKGVDVFLKKASWVKSGVPLTDEELDAINDSDYPYEIQHMTKYGKWSADKALSSPRKK
jgi:hypothetical protein